MEKQSGFTEMSGSCPSEQVSFWGKKMTGIYEELGTGKELNFVPSTQTAEINGAVAVASGGTLDFSDLTNATDQVALTGTITVESGGTFRMKNSATPNQSSVAYDGGKLVLKQGSTASEKQSSFGKILSQGRKSKRRCPEPCPV
jgi:hypothetical protein